MKTKTQLSNDLNHYLPEEVDYAFAAQISDLPGINDNIARIVVLYDYLIYHSQKRIILEAEIFHINVATNENVTNKFNSKIKDWIVTNQFFVMLRDEYGNMVHNPDYVKLSDRIPGTVYDFNQLTRYKLMQAFDYFALGFKNYVGSNQAYFENIILVGDEINDLFDVYGSLTEKLMTMPPEVNLNDDIAEPEPEAKPGNIKK